MSCAADTMIQFNANAVVAELEEHVVMIEDVVDPDGRLYRLEYRSTPEGDRALAFCLHNPWGFAGEPSGGEDYWDAHVAEDGFICLGDAAHRTLDESPFDLDFAIRRARFWCTGFSVLKETGSFPDP